MRSVYQFDCARAQVGTLTTLWTLITNDPFLDDAEKAELRLLISEKLNTLKPHASQANEFPNGRHTLKAVPKH